MNAVAQRLPLSATAIHQHLSFGAMVRIVWETQIWRVLCADAIPNDRFAMVLRNRDGEMQTVEMLHVQRVFAEVGEYAIC